MTPSRTEQREFRRSRRPQLEAAERARAAGGSLDLMGDEIGRHTAYFYNITTGQVEQEGQSKAKDLLGPFPDAASAANALQTIRDREARISAEDREWRGEDER